MWFDRQRSESPSFVSIHSIVLNIFQALSNSNALLDHSVTFLSWIISHAACLLLFSSKDDRRALRNFIDKHCHVSGFLRSNSARYCELIRFTASTRSSGKNTEFLLSSLFGPSKSHHCSSPLCLSLQIFGFFWLCSIKRLRPRPIFILVYHWMLNRVFCMTINYRFAYNFTAFWAFLIWRFFCFCLLRGILEDDQNALLKNIKYLPVSIYFTTHYHPFSVSPKVPQYT